MRRLCIALTWLAAMMTAGAQSEGDLVHTVAAGETLISIAGAYGVSLEQLLTLNELDPDAILPIGRRLVILADGAIDDAEEQAEENAEADAGDSASISTVSVDGLPPAPVVLADAPMLDPADIGPRLCFAVFADGNQNGMREPGEDYLAEATVLLLDDAGVEALQYLTDGQSEPHCLPDLLRRRYGIRALAPAGYGLTGADSLGLDLGDGGEVRVEFGAAPGLEAAVVPLLQPAQPDDSPPEVSRPSILRELSGLFVLLLAGFVLSSGMVVAIFVRGR